MFKNFLKIASRNLWRNKGFTVINISGLAIAMAGVILIGIWIQNELSFDRYYPDAKNLYKVYNRTLPPGEIGVWDITSGPLGNTLKNDFPEVKNAARIYWSSERLLSVGEKSLKIKGNEVDGSFLSMFGFPLLEGNAAHALDDINSMVITEASAQKLFGNENPMNKIVRVDNKTSYKITGVLNDLPSNTEFDFDYLVPLKANESKYSGGDPWGTNTFYTFVQLQSTTDIKAFNQKIKNVVKENSKYKWDIFLYPVSQTHLYDRFENGKPAGGRIETVRLMGLIGGLILLIACINFMNLSTAQSQKRAKEVGVRKVIGAGRGRLIGQFLTESILLVAMSGVIAVGIAVFALPFFNRVIESSLTIHFVNPMLWLGLIGFVVFTGLLAGSYPAFFLSSFAPAKVLKGSFKGVRSNFNPRKILVVLQFTVGIILVVATMVIYRQINFVQDRNVGYNINNLVEVPVEGDINKNYDLIKNELMSQGAVTAMSKTGWTVTLDGSNGTGYTWGGIDEKREKELNFSLYRTSGAFAKTMGLKLIEGRDIDLNRYPYDTSSVMINETAVKQMGIKDPIGKQIQRNDDALTIVGVFDDFIIGSPYENVSPMMVLGSDAWTFNTVMRLNPQNSTARNLAIAEKVFKKYNPAYPFSYRFVDREYAEKFQDEKRTATLSALFAGLTIFISCLGLFGLSAYMAENRSKEIGIRKVLGASVPGIVRLLSREFVALVLIAMIAAVPVGWWAMNKWLQNFTYRVEVGWMTFAVAGLLAVLITLLTVSFQAIKAAGANPVKSINTE